MTVINLISYTNSNKNESEIFPNIVLFQLQLLRCSYTVGRNVYWCISLDSNLAKHIVSLVKSS